MPEGRVSPNPLSPARLPGDGLGLDGRASCGSQHYSSGGNRAMERDGIRERADDLEREQKRERLSEREQGLGLSFDTSPSRRDEERGGYPGGGPPNRGRIVIDGMVVDANFLRSALTGVSAGGGTRREVAIQHQNLQTTRAGLTGGSRKAHVDGNAESIGEKPEVQSGGNAVGEPRGQRHDEKEARGFVEPSTVRSENSRRDVELGYQGSERERGGKGQLDASPRESGADKALRLAELEKEARELQGRLAEKVGRNLYVFTAFFSCICCAMRACPSCTRVYTRSGAVCRACLTSCPIHSCAGTGHSRQRISSGCLQSDESGCHA
jgi:hypothetical protein